MLSPEAMTTVMSSGVEVVARPVIAELLSIRGSSDRDDGLGLTSSAYLKTLEKLSISLLSLMNSDTKVKSDNLKNGK